MRRTVLWVLALLAAAFVVAVPNGAQAAVTVKTYPLPAVYAQSAKFTMTANGTAVPVTSISSDAGYDYGQFSTDGAVRLKITSSVAISDFRTTPAAVATSATVSGRVLTIDLAAPRYFLLTVNDLPGDADPPTLAVLADPLETNVPADDRDLVSDYGADPTGAVRATSPLQQAIDDANAAGGGTVYVPAGLFTIGNIVLRSNVHLYLAGGAVLRGTGNKADYTQKFFKDSLNLPGTWFISTATNSTNISITGRGTIDGNGHNLRPSGMVSTLIAPIRTTNFTIDGIVGRDAGLWSLVPGRSSNVTISNYKGLQSRSLQMKEDDALDVVESQNVTVRRTIGVSEDDSYSTKTWDQDTDYTANWPGTPETLSNVVVDDAVAWTRCAALKVGFGTDQEQRDITFSNSYVHNGSRAIAIDHRYGTAYVNRVTFDHIEVNKVDQVHDGPYWLQLRITDYGRDVGPVRNITLRDITVHDLGTGASQLYGLSAAAGLDEVVFQRITVPGVTGYASTLQQLGIPQSSYASDVMILPGQPSAPRDFAVGATATSSAGTPAPAIDGDLGTRWDSGRDGSGQYYPTAWYRLDLGAAQQLSRVNIVWEAAYAKAFTVRTSTDSSTWTQVYATTTGTGGNSRITFPATTARYVRVDMTQRATGWGYSFWELGAWNQ